MATNRSKKTMQEHIVEGNSGSDSVEELLDEEEHDEEQPLTDDQWRFLDGLERVGERLPRRGRDGTLPTWGDGLQGDDNGVTGYILGRIPN